MSPLIVGKKYRLRADALSKLGMAPGEVLRYMGRKGGGSQKEQLLPVYYEFKKSDGALWKWSRTTGELLSGYLEQFDI